MVSIDLPTTNPPPRIPPPLRQRHGILRLRCELGGMKHLLACLAILATVNLSAQWNANNDVDQDGCVGVGDVLQILSVFGSCEPPSTCVSPTMDGYTYDVVEIGDQCWFAENLRTTTYLNGDMIPAGLTNGDWTSTTSGATAVYGEGSSSCQDYSPDIDACDEAQSLAEYGRLYNWYAVDDVRGLCPIGWHVPTDEDWMALEIELGMTPAEASSFGWRGTTQGTQLKADYGWQNGGNGTDDFGFGASAGGLRSNASAGFVDGGSTGYWWSSSLATNNNPIGRSLIAPWSTIDRNSYSGQEKTGFAIRCRQN